MKTDTLIAEVPRETAGAEAQRAFDFQIHVSMARILELHATENAYIGFFDHFDDFVVVEGDDPEAEISFYQVKSSTNAVWTVTRLAKRPNKGDLPRSIIGKAYYNIIQFGPSTRRVVIVSNQPLKAEFASGGKLTPDEGEVDLSKLCKAQHDVLTAALVLDFPNQSEIQNTHILRFERVPFDLQSFRDTVLGRVADFVDKIGPDTAAIAKPFYDALLSEVGRCTGNKAKVADLNQLKKRKGIGRKDLDKLIDRAQLRIRTVLEWWPSVQAELGSNGVQALAERRLRRSCLEYWRARERGTITATKLSLDIRVAISAETEIEFDSVLQATTMLIMRKGLSEPNAELYDLRSAIIVELMEIIS